MVKNKRSQKKKQEKDKKGDSFLRINPGIMCLAVVDFTLIVFAMAVIVANGEAISRNNEQEIVKDTPISELDRTIKDEADDLRSIIYIYAKEHDEIFPGTLDILDDGVYLKAGQYDLSKFAYKTNDDSTEYELNVKLGDDAAWVMADDGGDNLDYYEVGTDLTLIK